MRCIGYLLLCRKFHMSRSVVLASQLHNCTCRSIITGLVVQGDLMSLKQGVHKQLQQLDISAAAAANSVALLKEVDTVKGRMEAACSTLKVVCISCQDNAHGTASCVAGSEP